MKNIIIKILTVLALTNIAHAEVISCSGITNDPNTTQMKFDIEIQSRMDKNSRQLDYKSNITYHAPDGSNIIQGIDLNGKIRTRLNKVIYAGLNLNNSLKLNFSPDNSLTSSVLNIPLAGLTKVTVTCDLAGSLPARPVCTEDIDKTKKLIDLIKFSNDIDRIETTIECGANVNKVDKNGCTPLMFALESTCGEEHPINYSSSFSIPSQVVDSLTNNGAFVNVTDKHGETPLIKAAKANIADVYNSFIASEAEFDAQDELGNTALIYAVLNGDESVVQQIIEGNPDRRIKNKEGKTAFDIATQWQKTAVMDLVKIPDTTVMVQGKEDGTCSPLQINLKQGQVVELTLKASSKMFKLESKKLGIDIMADGNNSSRITFTAESKGSFPFTCGFHGVNQVSQGAFTVQ